VGFVLRSVAVAVAIDVGISGWLLSCTVLMALFLALGKRRHEYLTLGEAAVRHRPILAEYSAGLLDQMIAVVTASTVTAYALYTMSPETVAKFETHLLPVTLPFVLYGIFRYLYLLYRRQLGGNPSAPFLNDGPLLVNPLLWILAAGYDRARIVPVENKTVVTDPVVGCRNNRWRPVLERHGLPFIPLPDVEWTVHRFTTPLLKLDAIFPEGIQIPKMFIGKNVC